MFTSLNVFKMAHAMAVHAGQRQALVAENVAHADTPGYRARDLPSFATSFSGAGADIAAHATRPGHLFGTGTDGPVQPRVLDRPASSNGNTVSIEDQMLQAADVKRQHDRALAIYKSSMTLLRTSLGRQ